MSGEDYFVVVVVYLKSCLFIYKALKISCNGSEIKQVTSQKLLGVTLDSHLNFTEHIEADRQLA